MQGRQGRGKEPGDQSASQRLGAVNGTGKQRPIPQRPPRMTHLDNPPVSPRVARPKRERPAPINWRKRLIIWSVVLVICGLLACMIGYGAVKLIGATSSSAGAATTVSDFLSKLSTQDYAHAYDDLGATITVVPNAENDFIQQAQDDDRCYGHITDYSEVPDSATVNGNTQTYTYTITRSNLSQPYQMRLTLQQENNGDWKITHYGLNNNLGPGQPPCS